MRMLITTLLLLTFCSTEADPYAWFQGEWVSDPRPTMANNPQYDVLDPDSYAIVSAMYGKVRWTISDNTMVFYDPRIENIDETEFSIEAIDDSTFTYIDQWGGNLRIWRTGSGFCMRTITLLGLERITECFRPFLEGVQ
ncbi:MAG: hypothetical protein QGG67_06720 [Gammaproteobacteria bacterium]|nr:hypothetical protein [Gammaproteobacteria bacterium]